jgi:hypothetical protein
MTRFKAGGIHLAISLGIAAIVGSLIYFIWFPPPYFKVTGGNELIVLIMGVDIVIGPLLTFAVFKSGKKSLRFDLTVIALLQASAFCYGFWVIANSRPVFVVARLDRFIVVTAGEIEDADLKAAKNPQFSHKPLTGPLLVGAVLPTDKKEAQDMLFSGLGGKDVEKFPKYYVPYADVADKMLAEAKPLAELAKRNPLDADIIKRYVETTGKPMDTLAYLPLQGHLDGYTMVLSTQTKQPLDALPIDPW